MAHILVRNKYGELDRYVEFEGYTTGELDKIATQLESLRNKDDTKRDFTIEVDYTGCDI